MLCNFICLTSEKHLTLLLPSFLTQKCTKMYQLCYLSCFFSTPLLCSSLCSLCSAHTYLWTFSFSTVVCICCLHFSSHINTQSALNDPLTSIKLCMPCVASALPCDCVRTTERDGQLLCDDVATDYVSAID